MKWQQHAVLVEKSEVHTFWSETLREGISEEVYVKMGG
jgi:hypothetical protein